MSRLALSLPPIVPIASSAIWAVLFGLLTAGLWWLKPWARWGTLAAITLYLVEFWIERLGFGQTDYLQMTIWFYVGFHLVVLLLFWGTLWRPKVRRAFSTSSRIGTVHDE